MVEKNKRNNDLKCDSKMIATLTSNSVFAFRLCFIPSDLQPASVQTVPLVMPSAFVETAVGALQATISVLLVLFYGAASVKWLKIVSPETVDGVTRLGTNILLPGRPRITVFFRLILISLQRHAPSPSLFSDGKASFGRQAGRVLDPASIGNSIHTPELDVRLDRSKSPENAKLDVSRSCFSKHAQSPTAHGPSARKDWNPRQAADRSRRFYRRCAR